MADFGHRNGGRSTGGVGLEGEGGFPKLACMLFWRITFEQGLEKHFKEFNNKGEGEAYKLTFEYKYFCGIPKGKTTDSLWKSQLLAGVRSKCLARKSSAVGVNALCSCGPRWRRYFNNGKDLCTVTARKAVTKHVKHVCEGIRALGCCKFIKQRREYNPDPEIHAKQGNSKGRPWTNAEVTAFMDGLVDGLIDSDSGAASKRCEKLKLK